MFLIVAKWKDGSDSIFIVGHDPSNRKLPYWAEIFEKLDTVSDPSDAQLMYARISRDFMLSREDGIGFSVSDDRTCSSLRPLRLPRDSSTQWFDVLGEAARELDVDPDDEPF